ncbi:MAG: 50S ribosomal protein L1 [Lentisphaeraceae bacterium]|nr:50S ribosomal protein L1 [Lentisphaeraceae bacterium]
MKRSKLYKSRLSSFDRANAYSLEEAVKIIQSMPKPKFDETIDVAFKLGIDTRQSDQNVRGAVTLPNGTGKDIKVVVVADGDAAEAAKAAGADEVGSAELIEKIKGGWTDFDVLVATPAAMKEVRTLGRVLGPRGLMPNPKTGTVTDDTAAAVKESKAGRVEYRADKGGAAHMPLGKVSFEAGQLLENAETAIGAILKARPASTKGNYVISCTLSATMSPGVKIDLKDILKV